jgi:hypothetical protein
MHRLLAMATFLLGSSVPAQTRLLDPTDVPARDTAAVVLAFGVDTWRSLHPLEGEQRLRDCLATAVLCLPPGSAARARAEALQASCRPGESLALGLAELADDLRFRPVVEAELPAGVPGFVALDELELRHYPAYRLARTSMRGGAFAAFWPLFRHIEQRDIAMTTPVQIEWRGDGDRDRAATMAFLYGSPELGPVGTHGDVEVVDQPPLTVLTIGARGHDRPARIAELRARIDAWLHQHPEWVVAGPQRTMGYNSPSMPDDRRYFEVQVPVRPRGRALRAGSV